MPGIPFPKVKLAAAGLREAGVVSESVLSTNNVKILDRPLTAQSGDPESLNVRICGSAV
jgi:hypothetical protein